MAAVQDLNATLVVCLGELPPPDTGFIGRAAGSCWPLQRLLRSEQYAVVRGQGAEGKIALAAELARWMVRSQKRRRTAFLSLLVRHHGGRLPVFDTSASASSWR